MKEGLLVLLLLGGGEACTAVVQSPIVVAADGSGDFRTIQAAIEAVPTTNSAPVIILIRKGIYREKLFITTSHLALVGEDRDSTRIVYAELRSERLREHPGSDWGAAVVNIGDTVTDLVLANLTVHNDYGGRTGNHDHQFALRSGGEATRIALLDCTVIADGGDTVSLWNATTGLSYHAHCAFEGWVDFVCPRGWCYITDSRFFGHNLSASIWHDGSRDRSAKFVLRSCRFDGVPGFPLGRYHRDAQFFLLDCSFSAAMADRAIYRVPTSNAYLWGDRQYYWNCHRDSVDFAWFADNLGQAAEHPSPDQVTAFWTFGGRWDPENTLPAVLPGAAIPQPRNGAGGIPASGRMLRWIRGRTAERHSVHLDLADPPRRVATTDSSSFPTGALAPGRTYFWRVDEIAGTDTIKGPVWRFTTGPAHE